MPSPNKQSAFSLIELSIVLVILGLLTGGILAGKSLIRGSELRSVGTDYSRYAAATHAFRDKYFALPGDMNTATAFWGALSAVSDAACQVLPASDKSTCNGDGNGTLVNSVVSTAERYRYFQHLANAGLIEGQYTGVAGSPIPRLPGTNVPVSKIANASFLALALAAPVTATTSSFAYNYGNASLGFIGSATTGSPPILLPEEAWNIDSKLDDGFPGTGRIIGSKGDGTTTFCTTAAGINAPGDAGAGYNLSITSKDCLLYFLRIG